MSRIGKKPDRCSEGWCVTVKIAGERGAVSGPRAKLDTPLRRNQGETKKTVTLLAVARRCAGGGARLGERALVNNAVEGRTKGWTKETGNRWHRILSRGDEGARPEFFFRVFTLRLFASDLSTVAEGSRVGVARRSRSRRNFPRPSPRMTEQGGSFGERSSLRPAGTGTRNKGVSVCGRATEEKWEDGAQ